MVSLDDLDTLALSLPETEVRHSADGGPEYRVRDKLFLCHRSPRKDAVDPDTGERLDDVLMFRTPDLEAKEAMLSDDGLPCFTTSHFDGWPAVLVRIGDLDRLGPDDLEELVTEAWLAQAPKRLAKQWLAEREAEWR